MLDWGCRWSIAQQCGAKSLRKSTWEIGQCATSAVDCLVIGRGSQSVKRSSSLPGCCLERSRLYRKWRVRNTKYKSAIWNRKPTGKNDHLHFYSHTNNNTKRGIIISFYLRALCICSSKYLNDEFNHIEIFFLNPTPTPILLYTLLNLKPSKSPIRINLKLIPTYNFIKLVPLIDS